MSCRIFIGTHDLYEVTANYTFSSSVFYEHPYYDPNEIANDVALVELPEKIVFGGKYCFEMIRNDNKNCLKFWAKNFHTKYRYLILLLTRYDATNMSSVIGRGKCRVRWLQNGGNWMGENI